MRSLPCAVAAREAGGTDRRRGLEHAAEQLLLERACSTYSVAEGSCKSTIAADFSPRDPSLLATTHGDHSVRVHKGWPHGQPLRRLHKGGHTRTPWTVAWHPRCPELLLSGGLDGRVCLWDAGSGGQPLRVLETGKTISSCSWHPAGHLAAICASSKVYLWPLGPLDPQAPGEQPARPVRVYKGRRMVRLACFPPAQPGLLITGEMVSHRERSAAAGGRLQQGGQQGPQQQGSQQRQQQQQQGQQQQHELRIQRIQLEDTPGGPAATGAPEGPPGGGGPSPRLPRLGTAPDPTATRRVPGFLPGWGSDVVAGSGGLQPAGAGALPLWPHAAASQGARGHPVTQPAAAQPPPPPQQQQQQQQQQPPEPEPAPRPCLGTLRVWRLLDPAAEGDGAEPRPLSPEQQLLAVPLVVLCSERSVGLSPCGRLLAAVVAAAPSGGGACSSSGADGGGGGGGCGHGSNQPQAEAAGAAADEGAHRVEYELRLISMEPASLGSVLAARAVAAADCITCVQISPTGGHVLLAYGRCSAAIGALVPCGSSLEVWHSVLQLYSLPGLQLVRQLLSPRDEVNVALWHPVPAGGIACGTREGRVRNLWAAAGSGGGAAAPQQQQREATSVLQPVGGLR